MPSEKTTPVPDELLRGLKRKLVHYPSGPLALRSSESVASLLAAIDKLPSPPPLDPVFECLKAFYDGEAVAAEVSMRSMRAALRRYRELGCPEIPE